LLDHDQISLKRMTIGQVAEMIAAGCFAMKRALKRSTSERER
jgi:hypothetical protein